MISFRGCLVWAGDGIIAIVWTGLPHSHFPLSYCHTSTPPIPGYIGDDDSSRDPLSIPSPLSSQDDPVHPTKIPFINGWHWPSHGRQGTLAPCTTETPWRLHWEYAWLLLNGMFKVPSVKCRSSALSVGILQHRDSIPTYRPYREISSRVGTPKQIRILAPRIYRRQPWCLPLPWAPEIRISWIFCWDPHAFHAGNPYKTINHRDWYIYRSPFLRGFWTFLNITWKKVSVGNDLRIFPFSWMMFTIRTLTNTCINRYEWGNSQDNYPILDVKETRFWPESAILWAFFQGRGGDEHTPLNHTQMLHVWNMYLHLPQKSPIFVGKYTIHGAFGMWNHSKNPLKSDNSRAPAAESYAPGVAAAAWGPRQSCADAGRLRWPAIPGAAQECRGDFMVFPTGILMGL